MKEVSTVDAALAKKISKAKTLTIYAVTYRYPDAERKPLTVTKARAAIKIAEYVFENCLKGRDFFDEIEVMLKKDFFMRREKWRLVFARL